MSRSSWLWLVFVVGLISSLVIAAPRQLTTGFGKQITAATNVQQVAILDGTNEAYAVSIKVENLGSNTVFCTVNLPLDVSGTAYTASGILAQSIPILTAKYFVFKGENLASLLLQTTNGTSPVTIGAN